VSYERGIAPSPPFKGRGRQQKKMKMNMNQTTFNPQELCSRKLWQLVNTPAQQQTNEAEIREAVAELAARRHYLAQLQEIGKLEGCTPGA